MLLEIVESNIKIFKKEGREDLAGAQKMQVRWIKQLMRNK
jgi:hypothetical protein